MNNISSIYIINKLLILHYYGHHSKVFICCAGGWNAGVYPVLVLVPPLTLPLPRLPAHRHHRTKQGVYCNLSF